MKKLIFFLIFIIFQTNISFSKDFFVGDKVNGVFDKDPELNQDAKHYKQITYSDVISKNLRIMDMTAITLCKENNLPIRVFDVNGKGNLNSILTGKDIGTIIS